MKKSVSLFVALVIILSSVSCFALEATVHETENNVYVEGKVETYIEKAPLTYTITIGDDVVYVGEYKSVNLENGTYAFKFKHRESLENALINIKYADEEVTTSVVKSTDTNKIIEADVYVTDKSDRSFTKDSEIEVATKIIPEATLTNGVVLPERTYNSDYARESRSGLKAVVNLKNKYAYEETLSILVAAYDENNKLLDCKVENVTAEYGENGEIQQLKTAEISVPENTFKAKAFCWNSTNIMPYGEEADGSLPEIDIFCIGDSYCSSYGRSYYPGAGWGDFVGDYLNSEYVTVKNLGVGSSWAQAIMSNTNDPIYQNNLAQGIEPTTKMYGWDTWKNMKADPDFNEGDYIIVSLGLNDMYREAPEGLTPLEWYAMAIEEMVKDAQKEGVNIILCSAMPTVGLVTQSKQIPFDNKAEEIANNYGITYLDVSNAVFKGYREEYNYIVGVTPYSEQLAIRDEIFAKYYLDRDALMDENHEFHLTEVELENHARSELRPGNETSRNNHPNLRGADNMVYHLIELLKNSNSDLRFYIR